MLKKDLIFTGLSFDTPQEAIEFGAREMCDRGYVKESYGPAVIEREVQFPTGLPTEPIEIAIPHTDSRHVNRNAVCMLKLTKPVEFRQMGDEQNRVAAIIVLLLAVSDEDHMDMLAELMELFSDEEMLRSLYEAPTQQETVALLSRKGLIDEIEERS